MALPGYSPDLLLLLYMQDEIEDLKKEVKKWQDKTTYFKKCLADTEMKLSEAFKEISDLRMDRDVEPQVCVYITRLVPILWFH